MFPRNVKYTHLNLILLALAAAGCSQPQPTAEQVAGPNTPITALRLGPTPAGGPSEAPTGSGPAARRQAVTSSDGSAARLSHRHSRRSLPGLPTAACPRSAAAALAMEIGATPFHPMSP